MVPNELYVAAATALLAENVIFASAYGIDSASLCLRKSYLSYLFIYTSVLTLVSGAVYFGILRHLGGGFRYARPFIFAALVFALSFLLMTAVKKFIPAYYLKFRRVSSNASIYGMTIGVILTSSSAFENTDMSFFEGMTQVFLLTASGIAALYVTSYIFSMISPQSQPKALRGLPTFFIASGLVSMVMCCFAA
ncbi:MAG: hypothetical protein LUE25_08460 [Clostridiales bacterium]|nr:hypothetical protein [Clostridiales bacterium]